MKSAVTGCVRDNCGAIVGQNQGFILGGGSFAPLGNVKLILIDKGIVVGAPPSIF